MDIRLYYYINNSILIYMINFKNLKNLKNLKDLKILKNK